MDNKSCVDSSKQSAQKYRLEWEGPNGKRGHGQWHDDKATVESWVLQENLRYPEIRNWVGTLIPEKSFEETSTDPIKEAWFRGYDDLPFVDQCRLLAAWNNRKLQVTLQELQNKIDKNLAGSGVNVLLPQQDYFSKIV